MTQAIREPILERFRRTHGWLCQAIEELKHEDLVHMPSPAAPPIAWHFWHAGRWADRFQAGVASQGELWEVEEVAHRWGFDPALLGQFQSGTGMDSRALASLPWPAKGVLLDYGRRCFTASEEALTGLAEEGWAQARPSFFPAGTQTTVGADVIGHLSHLSRHLGMIEALRGLHGGPGTVTI